jgi:hypothetical protein
MLTQRVLEQYHAHDLYWSADLVVALEEVRLGLALDWATECARSLVSHAAPAESKEQLSNWVVDLARLRRTLDSSVLWEKSNLVWHEERDFLHTAVAHLYAASAHLLEDNVPWYRLSVIRAANVMGDHDYYRQTSLAIPLALYEKLLTSSAAGT